MLRNLLKILVPIRLKLILGPYILTRLKFLTEKERRFRRQQKRTFGEKNPKSTFYIIRKDEFNFGLFAFWRDVIQHIAYAEKKGYIPIIDAKTYYASLLQDEQNKHKENAWDYYFIQPYPEWSLDDVYASKNVILADMSWVPDCPSFLYTMPFPTAEALQKWGNIANKHLRFNSSIMEYIAVMEKSLFPKSGKILGVSLRREFNKLRETNYVLTKIHPAQPKIEEYVQDIKKNMKEWNCNYLFLSIDDRETCDALAKIFNKQCIVIDRPRNHFYENGLIVDDAGIIKKEFDRENNVYLTAKEYIAEVALLSKCDCLLTGKSSGTQAAYIMNNGKYDHIMVYD